MFKIVVLALTAAFTTGCTDQVIDSRFPDFKEFIEITTSSFDDDAKLEASLELHSRLLLNSAELDMLFDSSEVENLLVVYLQAHFDDPRRVASLEKAIINDSDNRLVAMQQAAHCSYSEAYTSYKYCGSEAFEALIELDPENMVSYYIAAGYWGEKNNLELALSLLRKGNSKTRYDIYEAEFFRILTERAQAFGFPRYAADTNALGSFSTTMHTKLLFELCQGPISTTQQEIYRECLVMGEKIEESAKTLLGKGLGIGIQIRTLQAMGNSDTQVELIERRRDSLASVSDMLEGIPNDDYTEHMWDRFYEELFEVGEVAALRNLANRARGNSGDL